MKYIKSFFLYFFIFVVIFVVIDYIDNKFFNKIENNTVVYINQKPETFIDTIKKNYGFENNKQEKEVKKTFEEINKEIAIEDLKYRKQRAISDCNERFRPDFYKNKDDYYYAEYERLNKCLYEVELKFE